ncbi:hypothetical protein L5D93_27350 [Paenibacillus thiaminolyticus]|nr:hypothetical protein [Paenibacillus thiaminolyticus]
MLKIHLHNVLLLNNMLSIKGELRKGKFLYRIIEKSLPDLAEYVLKHPKTEEIKGIIGITMLNRGASGLGFETIPIRSAVYKGIKYVTMTPIYFFSASDPLKHIKNKRLLIYSCQNMHCWKDTGHPKRNLASSWKKTLMATWPPESVLVVFVMRMMLAASDGS